MSNAKRVACYVRVSTQEQSTELQKRELQAYTEARGWSIEVFEDKATGTNEKRPAFQAILQSARSRNVDVILVWKLDRFARSLKSLITHLQEFQELGVEFISLRDNIDLTTASGRLMMQIVAAFAEFEASIIKERVRAGLAHAKAKGKRLGRPTVINTSHVLRLRAEGHSIQQIATKLGRSKGGIFKALKQSTRGAE